jgi:hypothetical protein
MRGAIGLFVAGSLFASFTSLGCGHGPTDDLMPNGQDITAPPRGPATPTAPGQSQPAAATAAAAQQACAGVTAPTTLSTDKDIHDVRLVGSAVFYQTGTKIMRVGKDGSNPTLVFTSPDLVRAFIDNNVLVTLESTAENQNATLRVVNANNTDKPDATFPEFPLTADPAATPGGTDPAAPPALPGTTTATNFNAAGTQVFGSDDASIYVLADTNNGDTLVKITKANPGAQATITNGANVIGHPQLTGDAIWYVRDQQRIFKVGLDAGATPTEMFGIGYATCELAVSDNAAYCALGTTVERRDLQGGNPTTIVDGKSSKTSVPFGALVARDSTLFLPSEGPDPAVKNVITQVQSSASPAEQKFVACGRSLVTNVAVDGTSVVWSEDSGGVYLAPR